MAAGFILLLWLFCLPRNLFEGVAYSTVVTDRNGELLGARVANDGVSRCATLYPKSLSRRWSSSRIIVSIHTAV